MTFTVKLSPPRPESIRHSGASTFCTTNFIAVNPTHALQRHPCPARSGRFRHFNYIGCNNIRGDFFGGLTAAVIALPMALAFGVAKAINREHNPIGDCDAVIFDVLEVFHLGLSAALAIENAVEEAIRVALNVYAVGAQGTTHKRLEQFKLIERLPEDHTDLTRQQALFHAVKALK